MSTEMAADRLLEPRNRTYLTQDAGSLKSSSSIDLGNIILPRNIVGIRFTYQFHREAVKDTVE